MQSLDLLRATEATLSLARNTMGFDTFSTQRSPVHRVRMHGISNRDTHLYLPHNSSVRLTTAEWLDNTTRFSAFIPDIGTHPTGMTLPRTAWVCFNHLLTGVGHFRSCLHKWLWPLLRPVSVAQKTNRPPCCPQMSNPSTAPWTARPDVSWWRYNRMAVQHLPQDPVRPSSGQKELAHKMNKKHRSYSWK